MILEQKTVFAKTCRFFLRFLSKNLQAKQAIESEGQLDIYLILLTAVVFSRPVAADLHSVVQHARPERIPSSHAAVSARPVRPVFFSRHFCRRRRSKQKVVGRFEAGALELADSAPPPLPGRIQKTCSE